MKTKYYQKLIIGITISVLVTCLSCQELNAASSDDKTLNNTQILNVYDHRAEEGSETIASWGFSTVIRFNDKILLFDTGTYPKVLKHNCKLLGVDLSKVDIAIISHSHIDHIGGLEYLMEVNTEFELFLPNDVTLGAQRYDSDSIYLRNIPYRHINTKFIREHTEIFPGIVLIATKSSLVGWFSKYPPFEKKPKFYGLPELSLALKGNDGKWILISGCSHSGIEEIIKETRNFIGKNVSLVVGGFHHRRYSSEFINSVARLMKNELKVERVAPTHCTGEESIRIFKDFYKENFHYFGLGAKLSF